MDKEFKPLDESLITSEVCMRCAQCCKHTSVTQFASPNAIDYIDTIVGSKPGVELRWHNPIKEGAKVKHPYEVVNNCSMLKEENGLKFCSIYNERPNVCRDFNCFSRANWKKIRPGGWDKIKKVIKLIHNVDIEWNGPMNRWKLDENVINVKELK